ncbi:helix-turn-helix transcriptional regulator [Sphingomonas donggukensis]|uniref:Helix-turn-helix transcriptional regulator n=1 Tax=Sphingomonas donggukensis TaxID=2949093 RepID=A0ABY4TTH2_9SPHN|nr:helix-turn-helix transcriptional regulator [Sphingomonas donggukensis]URW75577.1 helix-turn-helix transcriptional regulator [Sphingomonas donggukensis]
MNNSTMAQPATSCRNVVLCEAGALPVHMLMENGSVQPAIIPELVDERSLCFESDTSANFVIDIDGTLRHANDAARGMVFSGLLQIDAKQRLGLARGVGRHGYPSSPSLRSSIGTQVRQIAPNRWLAVMVRPIPGAPELLHVRAREIRLDGEIDLSMVADEFGISDSEAPVLEGLAQAICPKEISRSLGLSIHTIRSHIRAIYAKIGVRTAAEAQRRVLQVYYVMKSIS